MKKLLILINMILRMCYGVNCLWNKNGIQLSKYWQRQIVGYRKMKGYSQNIYEYLHKNIEKYWHKNIDKYWSRWVAEEKNRYMKRADRAHSHTSLEGLLQTWPFITYISHHHDYHDLSYKNVPIITIITTFPRIIFPSSRLSRPFLE